MSCGRALLRSTRMNRRAHGRPPSSSPWESSWSRGKSASTRPDSIIALPRSMRLITPVTNCSLRCQEIVSRSARARHREFSVKSPALRFCAPMRPNSTGSSGSSIYSPSLISGLCICACCKVIWREGASSSSSATNLPAAERRIFPAVAVHRHPCVYVIVKTLLCGGSQRQFERSKNHVLVHAFFARQGIYQ